MDRTNVKAIALDLIAASYESSSIMIEQALSKLIRNPCVMKHFQPKQEAVVGLGRTVKEPDLPKLNYLDMVVKESFRMYSPGPLLVSHESTEDVEIAGYWERHQGFWAENVEEFLSERFANSSANIEGRDSKNLFGLGSCVRIRGIQF